MDDNRNGNGHLPGQFPPAISTNHIEQVATVTLPARKRSRIQQRDQAATLQRFAYDAACALREACTDAETGKLTMTPQTAKAVKELLCAWDTARDAVRVLRGKGLPASVRSKTTATTRQPEPLDTP